MAVLTKTNLCNEAFLQYMITNSPTIRNIICQKLIGDKSIITNTTIEYFARDKVLEKDKKYILARDEYDNLYNIEMLCYPINRENFTKYQLYASFMICKDMKCDEDYKQMRPLYQLIINASNKDVANCHKYEYTFRLVDVHTGSIIEDNPYTVNLIQLHHIDELSTDKLASQFNQIMYMLEKGEPYDGASSNHITQEVLNLYERFKSENDF